MMYLNMQNKNQKIDNMSNEAKNGKNKKYRARSNSRRKLKSKATKIKALNPMITHLNLTSHFIYDNDLGEDYLNRIKNKNLIKLNIDEIAILENEIEKLDLEKSLQKGENIIFIEKSMANDIKNYFQVEKNDNALMQFLTKEISNNKDRRDFSLRKLSSKYITQTGKYISKSTIHNCLRKQLGLKYLKTTIKTEKILEIKNIINSLAFLKVIIKCIKLKFHIIFLDETSIQNDNNNYYSWRFPNEELFCEIGPKKKLNLLMAIDEAKIIYYEINKENTDETIFLNFMKRLNQEIIKIKLTPCVIIMDNLSCHKTSKLIDFYIQNKINILFNIPYLSSFNAIELSFRNIKKFLYTKYFSSIEEVESQVKLYLNNEKMTNGIKENYKETLIKYKIFNHDYCNLNFNS